MNLNNGVLISGTKIDDIDFRNISKIIFETKIGKEFDENNYMASFRCRILEFVHFFHTKSKYFPSKYNFMREEVVKRILELIDIFEKSEFEKSLSIQTQLKSYMHTLKMSIAICEAFSLFTIKIKDNEGYIYKVDEEGIKELINHISAIENLVFGRVKSIKNILQKEKNA